MSRWNPEPAHVRVLARCVEDGDCWVWQGPVNRKGYGSVMCPDRRVRPIHRVTYMALVGPIPDGLTLDHTCRNKRCVNPWHLEPVPSAVNTKRAQPYRKLKTHCPHNHPYIVTPSGRKRCMECDRIDARTRWHRKNGTI